MIDELIDELEAGGRVDSEGEFTLDRAKAREKLQRFQLADPRAYVLELVQAASLKGATAVRFQIDSRDMVMELDGRPFTTADFDEIYGAALTRRIDPDVLARRQLAIGLGSAMALRPSFLAVESGDGKAGARLLLRPDEEDRFEPIETARVGTRIHVRERFGFGTFAAFFKNLAGTLAEEQLLRARCGHASFAIDLEGTRLDRGLQIEGEAVLDVIETHGEHTRAICGLREGGAGPASVRLIKDGVWIADHPLPAERFTEGFVAIVQDHALRKDVSQSDIVRDAAYEAMLGVLERGSRLALAALAERALAGTAPAWAERTLSSVLSVLAARGTLRFTDDPTGLVKALRRLPLWGTTDGRMLCLDDLFAEVDGHGSFGFTTKAAHAGLVLPERSFVVQMLASASDLRPAILTALFHAYAHDVTARLDAVVRREQARRAWRARPTAPVLPDGAYLCRRAFEGPGVRGEVGIAGARTDRASLMLVVDGCLLAEHGLAVPWLGLRMVVAADDMRPDDELASVVPTVEVYTALLHAAAAIPALYAELAQVDPSPWRDACAMSFLESTLRSDSLALVLGGHFDRPGALDSARTTTAIDRFGAAKLLLDAGLHTDAPHPTVDMPLWRTLGPRHLSLREILARARRGEPIVAVAEPKPDVEADILVLDADDRALLQPLLARPIVDGAAEVTRRQREREFLSRPVWSRDLDGRPPAVVVPIEEPGITGALRVVPRPITGQRSIRVLHRQRPLDGLQLLMVGEVEGWVEAADASPTPDYRYVKQDAALYRVRAAVLRAFAAACLKIADRCRAGATADDAAFLLEVLGLPFPGALRAAHDNLRSDAAVTPPRAAEVHEELYAELHLQSTEFVADRLERLSRSKTPLADLRTKRGISRPRGWALAAVDVLFPPRDDSHAMELRVLRPAAPLPELPLWRHHDGRPLTLAAIREAVERDQALLHTSAPISLELPERTMVLVDATQLEVLRRVVGTRRLLDGSATIDQLRRRQQLDARRKLDRVALPPGTTLVSLPLPTAAGEPALEGEVGLPIQHPGDPHQRLRLRLAAHVERTPIEMIELDDRSAHLVAAVSDDRLVLSSDHQTVIRNEHLQALVAKCDACVPALVMELAARWAALDPAVRKPAWYHVLDFLVARKPALFRAWSSVQAANEAFARAAAVPGLVAVGGASLSVEQLVQAHLRNERIDVLPAPHTMWGEPLLPPDRPVVCVDAYELAALRRMLPRVESMEAEWPRLQERARNRAAAPTARSLPEEAVLVSQGVELMDLEGSLAIPVAGHPLTIDLCAEGKVVATRSLPGVLPCWGSVAGARVRPNPQWTDAIVDDATVQALRLRSFKLYGKLVSWLCQHEDHREHERVATLLAEQVVALHRAERAGSLPEPEARLFAALRSAPLLPLGNGRRISLRKALQQRPDALAYLDLWEAPGHRLQQMYAEAPVSTVVPASATPVPAPPVPAPPVPAPPVPAPPPVAPPVTTARAQPASAPTSAPVAAAPPDPSPRSEPTPAPKPRAPMPEERLLDALRAELSLVRERNERLLSDAQLDRLFVRPLSGGAQALVALADAQGVVINRDHPVVRRALAEHRTDPLWCTYVASAVYTALNVFLAEITDADERTFLALAAELAGGR